MAVYTPITTDEAQGLIDSLNLGRITALTGCQGGIENTNYFVSTEQGRYVLTLFERLSFEQLPYYLELMRHLAQQGLAVPAPHANAAGEILLRLKGKPAAVVDMLRGQSQMQPAAVHCQAVGHALAQMHVAGQSFAMQQGNLRGLDWIAATVPTVLPHIDSDLQALLQDELAVQQRWAAAADYQAMPSGPIHADLFRDNVMFDGEVLSGFFDFYFAANDYWLFDVAVCLNDWCIDHATGLSDALKVHAFLDAYTAVRPLTTAEQYYLPAMRRLGALRFWTSRLWDFYLPREASMLQPHDPSHFERVLLALREVTP